MIVFVSLGVVCTGTIFTINYCLDKLCIYHTHDPRNSTPVLTGRYQITKMTLRSAGTSSPNFSFPAIIVPDSEHKIIFDI
jgi:hypothetical protein